MALRRSVFFVLAGCLVFSASLRVVHAQFYTTSPQVTLSMSPTYPTPGGSVKISVQSSLLDLSSATIVWTNSGKVLAQGTGLTTIQTTAGAAGTSQAITVQVSEPDGTGASASIKIAPATMDLLFDADSYVPPFYRGRTLPSAGSSLVLQAVPHFVRPDGTAIPDSDIKFTWKRNGEVMGSVSGYGRASAIVNAPVLYATDDISVDAISRDNTLAASASVTIRSQDPSLSLYEDHPLYGILYDKAFGTSDTIPESEMTLAAIPYFAAVASPAASDLQYAWKVNDTAISADPSIPNEITVSADPQNRHAAISLALTSDKNYLLDAKGSWDITLGGSAGAFSDPFHTSTQ